MPIKYRKPFPESVRHPRVTGINQRGLFTNKQGRLVEYETKADHILGICLDRRQDVYDFISFPKVFRYYSDDGVWKNHVPKYKAILLDRKIEYHDVFVDPISLASQATMVSAIEKLLIPENATYVTHTHNNLPGDTEACNLHFLFGYRAYVYCDESVKKNLVATLHLQGGRAELTRIIASVSSEFSIPVNQVSCCAYHLIWNGELAIDMKRLLVADSTILPLTYVWIDREKQL